jgi:hypothetical protein
MSASWWSRQGAHRVPHAFEALEAIVTVEAIEIDEAADVASVSLADSSGVFEDAVVVALQNVSSGSGHEYRVRPGSWVVVRS